MHSRLPASIRNTTELAALVTIITACSNTPLTHHSQDKPHDGYICASAATQHGRVIGDGHCVSFIKQCSAAPATQYWRPGAAVMSLPEGSVAKGTIIATFKLGRYPNVSGHHAAIYISHNQRGIWVWDQWRGKPVHRRLIRARNDNAAPSNTAQAYKIVL